MASVNIKTPHLKSERPTFLPASLTRRLERMGVRLCGLGLMFIGVALFGAVVSFSADDPSLNRATDAPALNWFGTLGATFADASLQIVGLASLIPALCLIAWGGRLGLAQRVSRLPLRLLMAVVSVLLIALTLANFPSPDVWPLDVSLGGVTGTLVLGRTYELLGMTELAVRWGWVIAAFGASLGLGALFLAIDVRWEEWCIAGYAFWSIAGGTASAATTLRETFSSLRSARAVAPLPGPAQRRDPIPPKVMPKDLVAPKVQKPKPTRHEPDVRQPTLRLEEEDGLYHRPPLAILTMPADRGQKVDQEALTQNARLLESVLQDFGVQGRIVKVRPGPVVTLYELEPAPGTKTSRVIGLADDIARSMSAVSVRIAVVPGSNVIGIELPNAKRETVYLGEMLAAREYAQTPLHLALALGKDIGGTPAYVDLARMPHLLIAGTTGSGKSVAVNTMILSLLYRLPPEKCRLIMIDPKMLELSIYDGIPHLLAPVVTDPGKAVVALKWAVREMEERYRAMSHLGVRNIDGYNQKITEALAKGETISRTVQTGFDMETGKPIYEEQNLNLEPLPFIVVIVDEMADLMLVAGKDVEGAIQRLAQMARAAGIHLIMATQRPSVDVITGTIKANFPTRISFQVTSKIDSRTILGEQGAEQLLGQGDMLYMAAGGRITRIHGPFVSDQEVEAVVRHLRNQGEPVYIDQITEEPEEPPAYFGMDGGGEGSNALYDQAVALVLRERKASTSFIQRHLQIGYNRAARLIEQMEAQGVVSKANHVGKREVLAPGGEESY